MITNSIIFEGHPLYTKSENIIQDMQKIFVQECGIYKAQYNFYDIPYSYFPQKHKKNFHYISDDDNPRYKWDTQIKLEILDEHNNIIITKYTNYTPCINLYGDGLNSQNTYYSIFEIENDKPVFNIYNISNTYKKSFICWYTVNLDIKITSFDNKYYAIIFDRYILSVTKLDDIINCEDNFIMVENYNIIPLLGQNKMFCIEIKNNIILFNNGKTCPINDIKYDISKFLLPGNPLYRQNLYNKNNKNNDTKNNDTKNNDTKNNDTKNNDTKNIKHFVHTCGIFTAEYDYSDHNGYFDSNIGKFGKSALVIFRENGNPIFEMNSICSPSIILYGDGMTRDGTKFCIGGVSIYDFNQKLIRTTSIGACEHHDIQRVNDKYAISNSIDVCCYYNFFGLIDLELFFNQTGDEEPIRAYDNARIYVPLYENGRIYATCADVEGFILNNGHVLKYEDAEDYDYSNGEGYVAIDFSKFGYNNEEIKNIKYSILRGNGISISIHDSSGDKKIDKIEN